MTAIRDLPLNTVFYTKWGNRAASFYLIRGVFDARLERADDFQMLCTNRSGLLCAYPGPDSQQEMDFQVAAELNQDPQRLMQRLEHIWSHAPEAIQRDATGQPRQDRATRPVMDLHTRVRTEGNQIPRLAEGQGYRMSADWALPYHLIGGVRTRLMPFQPGGMSQINGRNVPLNAWNSPRIVSFVRADSMAGIGDHADILRRIDAAGADRTKVYVTFHSKLSPTQGWVEQPPLVPPLRNLQGPRAVLPHHDGFVFLLTVWETMRRAFQNLSKYQLAESFAQKDRVYVAELLELFELTAQHTNPNDDGNEDAVENLRLGLRHLRDLRRRVQSLSSDLRQVFWSPSQLGPFQRLLDLFDSPSFAWCQRNVWWAFPHFTGPLTFLELAVWLIAQSPLQDEYYQRHGRDMLRRAGTARTWEGSRDQSEDPMLLDTRWLDQRVIEGASDATAWIKRSVKVYSSINQLFVMHHTSILARDPGIRSAVGLGSTPRNRMPSEDDLKNFLQFVTGMSSDDFGSWWGRTRPLREQFSSRVESREATRRRYAQHREFLDDYRASHFRQRGAVPAILAVWEAFEGAITLIGFFEQFSNQDQEVAVHEIVAFTAEVFGVADSVSNILGLLRVRQPAFMTRFVPVAGAILNIAKHGAVGTHELLEREDDTRAALHGLNAVASSLALAAMFTGGVTLGAGTPLSVVLLAASAVLAATAELGLAIDRATTSPAERYGEQVYRLLVPSDEPRWWVPDRRTGHVVSLRGRYRELLRRHHTDKTERWDEHGVMGAITDSDTWDHFAHGLWQYIKKSDRSEEAWRAYRAYLVSRGVDDLPNRSGTRPRAGGVPPWARRVAPRQPADPPALPAPPDPPYPDLSRYTR